ncbi:hypothetical protein Nepgr_010351 [Nepenthes gracilis]|uniref:Agenet domain-containing protein n=1 Tax=Nepenthes gracilis TaxID=150966 RepID=A0AAD3SCZ9_NEPGR|nr:hypothetical protein Nepgr_010351 [Nepenthes gracilis]
MKFHSDDIPRCRRGCVEAYCLGEVVDIYKMAEDQPLPFKVGQLAESRSFVIGFRSAWFRCKIKKVLGKRSPVHYAMEYFDFPDEKIRSVRLYQKPPKKSNTREEKLELMVRPHYPVIYRESEMPDVGTISEVIVVTDCAWKVGDLVDWFTDGCFWSGRVTEIVDDNMVKIELPEPPIGEGSVYEVFCKDLRPSLDWSPEFGWTIPESMATEKGHVCARLIQPVGQARSLMPVNTTQHYRGNDILKHSTIISEDEMQAPATNADVDVGYSDIGKSSCSDCISSSCVKDVSAEVPRPTLGNEQYSDNETSKKLRLDESIPINSLSSDSIESTIMDLEELHGIFWNTLEFPPHKMKIDMNVVRCIGA